MVLELLEATMDESPKRDPYAVVFTGLLWREADQNGQPQIRGYLMRDGHEWVEFTGCLDPRRTGRYLLVGRVKGEPQPSLPGLAP